MDFGGCDAEVIGESWVAPEAFGVIFDRHASAIHRYLEHRLSRSDADELLGEVFRIAFERRRSYDPGRASCLPWLYGIASNLVMKHRRHEARSWRAGQKLLARDTRAPEGFEDGVHARIDAERRAAAVQASVAALPAEERNLVLLAAWTDLTYEQIAEALEVPVGTVRSRLSRSRAKLRELLGSSGEQLVEPPTRHEKGSR